MDLSIALFKTACVSANIVISTKELRQPIIPQTVPGLMKEFYARFAPISIKLLNVQFWPYDVVLEFFNKNRNDLSYIPISFYNNDPQQTAYIDKNPDGSWDYRVQLPIGNGKVSILGEDVFDYLIKLSLRLQNG